MAAAKDNLGDKYALLLLGIVLLAFIGGYIAGHQKVET
jgi:hypothetical protein